MNTYKAYVAIMMWFATGEGWARHPFLEEKLGTIRKQIKKYAHHSKIEMRISEHVAGGLIVGFVAPDNNCRHVESVDRNPFIVKLAYVDHSCIQQNENVELLKARIYQSLKEIESPNTKGIHESLVMDIEVPHVKVEPKSKATVLGTSRIINMAQVEKAGRGSASQITQLLMRIRELESRLGNQEFFLNEVEQQKETLRIALDEIRQNEANENSKMFQIIENVEVANTAFRVILCLILSFSAMTYMGYRGYAEYVPQFGIVIVSVVGIIKTASKYKEQKSNNYKK